MKCLKQMQVNDEVFNKILYDFEFKVVVVEDLFNFYNGYWKDKDKIYFNGRDEFICLEYIVNNYTNLITDCTSWKQIRVIRTMNIQKEAVISVTGSRAKAYINKMLKQFYTDEEIDERLHMFEADRDEDLKQQHYNYPVGQGKLLKISNTYKFDINGAHLDALCEIFPKASSKFLNMYEKRKQKPVFKQYPNLYVGMLAQKSKAMREQGIPGKYEKTYNWIVQRTTKLLLQAIDEVGGELVYVNTDGFIVQNPKTLLSTSKTLGEFKLEFAGDTFVYRGDNYIVYQTGDELKGSCFTEVRKYIDLRKGQTVSYSIEQTKNEKGQVLYRKPVNIMKVEVNIDEN